MGVRSQAGGIGLYFFIAFTPTVGRNNSIQWALSKGGGGICSVI